MEVDKVADMMAEMEVDKMADIIVKIMRWLARWLTWRWT